MAIYRNFQYGDGTLYGTSGKINYSAEPVTLTALGKVAVTKDVIVNVDSNGTPILNAQTFYVPKVQVTWVKPTGDIFGFRIVRNQEGYSEHEEDGVIVLESFFPPVPEEYTTTDGDGSVPLLEGRFAFYTVWVKTADAQWITAGMNHVLIPIEHGVYTPDNVLLASSTRKLVDLFPKVFSTSDASYLGEVDESSDFFSFMKGIAYTHDEILTFVDLLKPSVDNKGLLPTIAEERLKQSGFKPQAVSSFQRQKSLLNNMFTIVKNKGTLLGIDSLSTSVTNLPTSVSVRGNLLLNPQDSTFYKGIGNWTSADGSTITSKFRTGVSDTPVTTEAYAIDLHYTGEIVVSGAGDTISLGKDSPLLKGIPVEAETAYYLSFYANGAGTGTLHLVSTLEWYDRKGVLIDSDSSSSEIVSSSFTKHTLSATSPAGAVVAVISIAFAEAGTFHVDMVQLTSVVDYPFYESRAVEVALYPNKVNYLPNPSLNSIDNWTLVGEDSYDFDSDTTAPNVSKDGSKMLAITTVDGDPFSIETWSAESQSNSHYMTFSIYAKSSEESPLQDLTFRIEAFESNDEDEEGNIGFYPLASEDANGDPIVKEVVITDGVSTDWVRYEVSVNVIGGAGTALVKCVVEGIGTGGVLYLDAAQVEAGRKATDYFDGSYSLTGARWSGTELDSPSMMFRNKDINISKLAALINNYLPLNTPWLIRTGYFVPGQVEASGFSS